MRKISREECEKDFFARILTNAQTSYTSVIHKLPVVAMLRDSTRVTANPAMSDSFKRFMSTFVLAA